jgi:hypothetical protein
MSRSPFLPLHTFLRDRPHLQAQGGTWFILVLQEHQHLEIPHIPSPGHLHRPSKHKRRRPMYKYPCRKSNQDSGIRSMHYIHSRYLYLDILITNLTFPAIQTVPRPRASPQSNRFHVKRTAASRMPPPVASQSQNQIVNPSSSVRAPAQHVGKGKG